MGRKTFAGAIVAVALSWAGGAVGACADDQDCGTVDCAEPTLFVGWRSGGPPASDTTVAACRSGGCLPLEFQSPTGHPGFGDRWTAVVILDELGAGAVRVEVRHPSGVLEVLENAAVPDGGGPCSCGEDLHLRVDDGKLVVIEA